MTKRLHVSIAAEKSGKSRGQRDADQLIDHGVASRCPSARKERVTSHTSQIERRGQRAHGFDMGPPSFPALQRAHRMDGQARNRCEFLLREARSLAKRLEMGTK